LDGQAGFRNAGGEHNLALSRRRRREGRILRRPFQITVQGKRAYMPIETRLLE
jgi:hypothetical protein